MDTGSFPGIKRPGRDDDHPRPSISEVKEGVERYLYPSPPLALFWGERDPYLCQLDITSAVDTALFGLSLKRNKLLFLCRCTFGGTKQPL